jgi:hypothetical protein
MTAGKRDTKQQNDSHALKVVCDLELNYAKTIELSSRSDQHAGPVSQAS